MWLSLFAPAAAAQAASGQPGTVHSEADILWRSVEQAQQSLKQVLQPHEDIESVTALLSSQCGVRQRSPEQMKVAAILKESEALAADKGLEVRGGYTFGEQGSTLDDEDANAYLELNWNILKEGYRSRQDQANVMRYQAEVARLTARQEDLLRANRCRDLNINHVLATMESTLLGIKKDLMLPVYQVEQRAYFKGWSFLDELLISEAELYGLQKSMQRLNAPGLIGKEFSQLKIINPPIIDIDLAAVISAIETDDKKIRALKAEKMAAYYNARLKDRKDRLRLFVRKNFDQRDSRFQDDGVVAGFRFTIPLSRSSGTSLDYEHEKADAEYELETWQRIARARSAYIKLHEQLERVTEQQYRYLRSSERVRRSMLDRQLQSEVSEVATGIIRTRSMINTGIELVKAKAELYQRVNNLFYQARVEFQPDFIKLVSVPTERYRARPGKRSLYVWSKTFNSTPNDRLWHFIEAKGIKQVILSAARKVDKDKMKNFTREARDRHVEVALMLGSRDWIFSNKQDQAMIRSLAAAEYTGHLHLDIEPHTLPEFKQNRRNYLDAYIKLIENIKTAMSPGDRLSVSVPLHWDIQDYVRLNNIADEIYFMAYEMSDVKRIERRLAPLFELVKAERVTIALRPQDFADEWALEQTVMALMDRFGVNKFALHHARTYMQMPVAEQ